MTRLIWKFIIPLRSTPDSHTIPIEMPDEAQILAVREQGDALCFWAQIHQTERRVTRTFAVFGTGHEMPPGNFDYLGTAMFLNGELVLHVYERPDAETRAA